MTDDQLDTFEAARTEGIRDTVKFIMSQNPGMTREQAEEEMRRSIQEELANPLALAFDREVIRRLADADLGPHAQARDIIRKHDKRATQRVRRRIRMARKRRRGWA